MPHFLNNYAEKLHAQEWEIEQILSRNNRDFCSGGIFVSTQELKGTDITVSPAHVSRVAVYRDCHPLIFYRKKKCQRRCGTYAYLVPWHVW
jgi:hypothetical protein